MLLNKWTLIGLGLFSILLSSCEGTIPTIPYDRVERCDQIYTLKICRCSDYDFNTPEKVGVPYDMPYDYCNKMRVTFSIEQWNTIIVATREAKAFLERSNSKKQYIKRFSKVMDDYVNRSTDREERN